jgi:CubicO group peptidase (beta-lactamase class C family)
MKYYIHLPLIFILINACGGSNVEMEMKIDKIFEEFQNNSTPGVAVAIIKNNGIIYKKGFGVANLESKTLIEPHTNFRLASITKQFTALSVLMLENDGKLKLDDDIIHYIPELKHYTKGITLKNIMQHTSGLIDYEDFVKSTDTSQLKDEDVLKILAARDSTYFDPGSKHRYSNSGYAVLAMLIERVSGLSFADFLDQRIFKPLKMNNSVAYEKGISIVKFRALGYTETDDGYLNTDQSLTSAVLGDGGIYSSVNDLIKWDEEFEEPTLLPRNTYNRIFKKGRTIYDEEFDYGLGWRLDPYKGLKRHYHTGGTSGFTNIYMKLPDLDLTIIILMNLWDYNAKGYAEKIADIFIN